MIKTGKELETTMKHVFRILCLLLILSMMSLVLIACGDEGPNTSNDSADTANSSNPASGNNAESGTGDPSEEVGFRLEKQNFNGTTIKFLTDKASDYYQWEVSPSELAEGDRVNNAFYNRARLIEQEYGLELVQEYAESQNDVVQQARDYITTGLDEYQVYVAGMIYLSQMVADELFLDISSIDSNNYIDLSKPYWDQSIVRDLTVLGSTYFITGDALVTDDDATWAIFFNKDIAENYHVADKYGVESLYDLVHEDRWTLDVMFEIMQEVKTDAGDSGMAWGPDTPDTWGLIAQCYDSYAFTVGAGQTLMRNDGTEIIITAGDQSNINAFAKVFDMLTATDFTAIAESTGRGSSDYYGDMTSMFANGKGLFMPNKIATISDPALRDANIRYGLLPMPKYDDQQENYTTTVTVYWCSAFAIPITNSEKLDATCYALEALAYYGMEQVTPEYYEHTLKDRRLEDTESMEMLDLIFRNRTYDMGAVFNLGNSLGFYTSRLFEGLSGQSNQHVSALESVRSSWEMAIEDYILQAESSRG